jgi:hypothetical protein
MPRGGFAMRWSIWGPVAVCVLALVGSAMLPHTDVRSWHMPVTGSPWIAAPSWPVPTLRGHARPGAGSAWSGWAPSWPVPALRRRNEVRPARGPEHPVAGVILRERSVAQARAVAGATLLLVVAGIVASHLRVRSHHGPAQRVRLARTVTRLADQGVAQSHIARRAGLARDAVRALLRESVTRSTQHRA